MSNLNFLTIGEAIDQIQPGNIAVSIHPDDEGTILAVNKENWIMIKHPSSTTFRYEHFMQKDNSGKTVDKRWLIMKEPENFFDNNETGEVIVNKIKKSLSLEDK